MKIIIVIILFVLIIATNNNLISANSQYFSNANINIFENLFTKIKNKFENISSSLEYTVEINANHIFPNDTIKNKVLKQSQQVEYLIPVLEYYLLGFGIFATDIK